MPVRGDEAEMPTRVASSSLRQGHLAPGKTVGRLPETLAARAAADGVEGPVSPGRRVRDGPRAPGRLFIKREAL